jgi:hypothetical protein
MRKSSAHRNGFGFGSGLLRAAPLALFVGAFSALFGCASEEGVAPTCTQDVNGSGHQAVENGCNPFAVCKLDDNNDGFLDDQDATREPIQCCQQFQIPGKEYDFQLCMYGYGAGALPTSSSSSSGGGGGGAS